VSWKSLQVEALGLRITIALGWQGSCGIVRAPFWVISETTRHTRAAPRLGLGLADSGLTGIVWDMENG
jgi:hypothetical protein